VLGDFLARFSFEFLHEARKIAEGEGMMK
jgi:hypothetical protein